MKGVILFQVQQQQWCALLLFLLLAAEAVAIAAAAAPPPPPLPIAKHRCRDKCENISVPYPFGLDKPECYKSKAFRLECVYCDHFGENGSDVRNKKWRLRLGGFDIENISVSDGTATTYLLMSFFCYNNSDGRRMLHTFSVNLTGSPFTFSSVRNKFTGLGCDTQAFMMDGMGLRFSTGCMSLCNHRVNLLDKKDGGCLGVGCCHTQVPKGCKNLNVSLKTFNNFESVKDFSPCSFAFLADQDWSNFTSIDLMDTSFNRGTHVSPAVLDWVVGEDTCQSFDHHSNSSSYACGANTNCNNSYNGPGYLCSCKIGYEGNPYLPQGCQDVDECMYPERYKCEGRCKNTEGSYTCHCQLGMSGDGKVGCKGFRLSTLGVVIGVCLSLVVTIFFLLMECKRMNRARNFRKNGGTLLKLQNIKIYREKELKKATSNYDAAQLVGKGASGSVYKGVLMDTLVAIKKPNIGLNTTRRIKPFRSRDEMKKEFQHEIGMICKVSHTNIVKLKGLCLETNVPLLVYEFISNGSLFDHIHTSRSSILNSWKTRLRVAYEIALALDYMHSRNGTTLIHRDVKSMNILLDQNCTVKVADFGSSILIPIEQSVIKTKILGTHGYLDPEYWITSNLTVKSDVYSFGVVLMELLTSQMPISKERSIEQVNFIPYFISSVVEKNIGDVLNVGGFDNYEEEIEQVKVVVKLAVRCLNTSGIRRPDMNEVVEDLLRLMKLNNKYGGMVDQSNIEEIQSLLGGRNNEEMARSSSGTQYMTASDLLLT